MPVAIEVGFPWGRYHATAWDRSANEGVPDWPPAPWRILRALYATWRWYCDDLPEELVHGLLAKLAEPPRYQLPRFTIAHSRHYYPADSHIPVQRTATAKTIDAFVVTERAARLVVEFPADLNDAERDGLDRLVRELSYLGRADSLVDATLVEPGRPGEWLEPWPSRLPPGGGLDLLAPSEPFDIRTLLARPRHVRAARLRRPEGTRWVSYPRPTAARVKASRADRLVRTTARPTAVRLALTGPSLPAATNTVLVGDYLRRACLAAYGRTPEQVSPLLAGKAPDGSPLTGRHEHAHFIAFATSNPKLLDAAVVWAPGGLGASEVRAITSLARLRSRYHRDALRDVWLGVEAVGDVTDVAPELCGPAFHWSSRTPFAPTRHGRGEPSTVIADNVRWELRHRGQPEPVAVELVRGPWLDHRRHRASEALPDARRAYGLQLSFAEPLAGPLALGQLSHFGLGAFVPDNQR